MVPTSAQQHTITTPYAVATLNSIKDDYGTAQL
jgi:hypothetical protein